MKTQGKLVILNPGDRIASREASSIFLAGPTPRSKSVKSWRPEALSLLESLSFDGTVMVPERDDWVTKFDYVGQVEWELRGMEQCSVIVFWVPRDMATMPALTTNVEFGMSVKSGRILYGRPDGAPHTAYLDYLYRKHTELAPFNSLNDLMLEAIKSSVAKDAKRRS